MGVNSRKRSQVEVYNRSEQPVNYQLTKKPVDEFYTCEANQKIFHRLNGTSSRFKRAILII